MSFAMAGDWFKKAADSLGQVRDKAADAVDKAVGKAAEAVETAVDKAADAVAEQQVSFVRGKIAGKTVLDDAGQAIVEAGHVIDDTVIEHAYAYGKLHLLTSTVVKAKAQDLKEKAKDAYAQTDHGQESAALDSVDQYVEARRYLGKYAGIDVTDIRGNVLVPMGKQIDAGDVSLAREAGQLGALIYAAQQPLPEGYLEAKAAEAVAAEYQPKHTPTYHRPKPLPLVGPDE